MTPLHEDLPLLYDSGELAPPEREGFERHLPGCPACRDTLEALKAASGWTAAAAASPHPGLVSRSLRRATEPGGDAWLGGFLPAAAGLAFSVLVLAQISRPGGPPQRADSIEDAAAGEWALLDRIAAPRDPLASIPWPRERTPAGDPAAVLPGNGIGRGLKSLRRRARELRWELASVEDSWPDEFERALRDFQKRRRSLARELEEES